MLLITKDVASKLHNEYGIKYKDNGISTSKTKHKKYYLCESEYNLKCLLKINANETVEKLLKEIIKRKKEENEYIY